ncbi:hypothetical protein J6590_009603 [Homalodisca vitripennis]|nr:hypothetical protein J6590_009603 [Homalodisca vitripennis]
MISVLGIRTTVPCIIASLTTKVNSHSSNIDLKRPCTLEDLTYYSPNTLLRYWLQRSLSNPEILHLSLQWNIYSLLRQGYNAFLILPPNKRNGGHFGRIHRKTSPRLPAAFHAKDRKRVYTLRRSVMIYIICTRRFQRTESVYHLTYHTKDDDTGLSFIYLDDVACVFFPFFINAAGAVSQPQ